MNYLFTAIVFILVFSVLIFIHELGHFLMAKRSGIKVEEFGFGMPPRIWGKKKGETVYSINWIPIGGFVRLFGEDSTNAKHLKSKRSFIGKPMSVRIKVIVAGVVMNFLLAWVLMSIGFTIGMQPLFGPDDVLGAVSDGRIVLEEGIRVKSVDSGSIADKLGLLPEDLIIAVDNRFLSNELIDSSFYSKNAIYTILREDQKLIYQLTDEQLLVLEQGEDFGVNPYVFSLFPRVRIFDLDNNSQLYNAGLRQDDVIIAVNGREIFSIQDYEDAIRGVSSLEYLVYREGIRERIFVSFSSVGNVVVSQTLPDSPAEKSGFSAGDIIISINGYETFDVVSTIDYIREIGDKKLAFLVNRNGERLFLEVFPENDQIGVLLSELVDYEKSGGVVLYNVNHISTVAEILNQKYPFYEAPLVAVQETYRLSKLTASMFVLFIKGVVSSGEVSENIAGPIGIAQLTHIFVQEGIISLLRFVAILSLSLAVINILPIPALDGGRLLFIFVEFLSGRKVNQKLEAVSHAIGYVLILLLIIVVTYNDILRLLRG